jgi:tetratricopeptide (TPR) repeat protein
MTELSYLRETAGKHYQQHEYNKALEFYELAIDTIKKETLNDETKQTLSLLYSNACQCCLQIQQWKKAVEFASFSLQLVSSNVKALYRRAIAYEKLNMLEDAIQDITKAMKIEPENPWIQTCVKRQREKLSMESDRLLTEQLPETAVSLLKKTLARFLIINTEDILSVTFCGYATLEDCCDISTALKSLRSWFRSKQSNHLTLTKQVTQLLGCYLGAVTCSSHTLPPKIDESTNVSNVIRIEDYYKKKYFLIILVLIVKTLNFMLIDWNHEEEENVNRKNNDITSFSNNTLKERRNTIHTIVTESILKDIIEKCIWGGLGESYTKEDDVLSLISLEKDPFFFNTLRTTCVVFALKILQRTTSIQSNIALEAFYLAVNASNSLVSVECSLTALSYVAEAYRRLGRQVIPLQKSQALIKLLECLISLLISTSDTIQKQVHYALLLLFTLLADTFGMQEQIDICQNLTSVISPYMNVNEQDDYEKNLCLFQLILLLAKVDRKSCSNFLLESQHLFPLFVKRLQEYLPDYPLIEIRAIELLIFCMEFPSFRQQFINLAGYDIIKTKLEKNILTWSDSIKRIKLLILLSRLCIHNEEIRSKVFQDIPFVQETFQAISLYQKTETDLMQMKTSCLLQFVFEIFFFLSLHGTFKEQLDDMILTSFIDLSEKAIRIRDTLACFFYLNGLCNLLHSRHCKERLKQKNIPGGIHLDQEQLQALQEFYEKLPDHAKPTSSQAKYDRGSDTLTNALRQKLLQLNVLQKILPIALWSSPKPSLHVCIAWIEVFGLFLQKQEERRNINKVHCILPILQITCEIANNTTNDDTEDLDRSRQVLSQACIAINPTTLTYTETLSILSQLIPLLSNSYELYQYEATLACTNLISHFHEAKELFYYQKGIQELVNIISSDNALCRAASLECLCNMATCSIFIENIIKGQHKIELQLLLAFLRDTENLRAKNASAGCLAMLTNDYRVCLILIKIQNAQNLFKVFIEQDTWINDSAFQIRFLTIIHHFCQLHSLSNQPHEFPTEEQKVQIPTEAIEFQSKLRDDLRIHWSPYIKTFSKDVSQLYHIITTFTVKPV